MIDANLNDVSNVEELKASIQSIGLLHAITVRQSGERFELVTGRKRLKAIMELGATEIPVFVETSQLTPIEIAIHENLRRDNLEWWAQVDLEAKLHELRISQHGKKRVGRNASSAPGWSQTDTARELGIALGAMSQDLFLADAVRKNPHLAKISDKSTALRLVKEAAKRESIEIETLAPDLFEMNQVFFGDSSEILKEIPNESFDVCITDPPWLEYRDESLTRDEFTTPVFKEIYRVLKRDTLLYIFVGTPDFYYYKDVLKSFGFAVQEYPLIWDKGGIVSLGTRSWEYYRSYELILLAAKGKPVLTDFAVLNPIFKYPIVHNSRQIHPNEKPVELMKELIRHSTFDGARVLDPFAGSGSTLVAARELGRKFIGIERNRDFYLKILKRLEIDK